MPINAEQNQQKEQEDKNNLNSGSSDISSGGGPQAQNVGRVANYSTGAAPQSSGSGRYTNLQKYISANQGAGERLASGISNRVTTGLEQNKKEAQTQAGKVAEGIESAQNKLNVGQNYLNQVQGQDFDPTQFAANQNQLNEFGQFRTGQAIDQAGLQNQNTQAQNAYQNAQQLAQQRLGQVGNEQGRFNLLQQTYGGGTAARPTYSTGQQRLDQLFLQTAPNNQVKQLQNQVQQNLSDINRQKLNFQNTLTNPEGQDIISQIGTGAQNVAQGLQNQTNKLNTNYYNALSNQATDLNTQRALQNEALSKVFHGAGTTAKELKLTPEQEAFINQQLGGNLQLGQRTFGTLADDNYKNYITEGKTNLSAQNLIDQQALNKLQALGNLSGQGVRSGYEQVGNKGPETTIASQQLAKDIQDRQQQAVAEALNNKFASNQMVGQTAMGPRSRIMGSDFSKGINDILAGKSTAGDLTAYLDTGDLHAISSPFVSYDPSGRFANLGYAAPNASHPSDTVPVSATEAFYGTRPMTDALTKQISDYLNKNSLYETLGGGRNTQALVDSAAATQGKSKQFKGPPIGPNLEKYPGENELEKFPTIK